MLLENNKNTLIADSKEDCAQAILTLYRDKNLWNKLQSFSEESLAPFSLKNLENQIEKIENLTNQSS